MACTFRKLRKRRLKGDVNHNFVQLRFRYSPLIFLVDFPDNLIYHEFLLEELLVGLLFLCLLLLQLSLQLLLVPHLRNSEELLKQTVRKQGGVLLIPVVGKGTQKKIGTVVV